MKLFLVFSILFTLQSSRADSNLKDLAINSLVERYLHESSSKKFQKKFDEVDFLLQKATFAKENCVEENPSSCIDTACKFLPSYKCDDISEIQEIGAACLGQPNGDCINNACGFLPSYKCDDISEIQEIGVACKGNFGSCLKEACSFLPSYKCDDISEIQEIGKACENVSDNCMKDVCAKLPSYKCDDISEIQEIGKVCKGN